VLSAARDTGDEGGLLQRRRSRLEVGAAVRRASEGGGPIVVVYQMAKVGSSTITAALRDFGGMNVFQVHLLGSDAIERWLSGLRKFPLARFQTGVDIIGTLLYRGLIEPGLKLKIITLVRDPIARNCSFYFHNLDFLLGTKDAHDNVELPRLLSEFRNKFDHRGCLRWFDNDFKPVLGVDVYEHPFPHDKGHARITTDRYDILILRTDLDDESKKKCVEEFLGIEGLSLKPKNVGSQKPYATAYRNFLDALELPESYVDEMLDSKYTRHFFGPDERASLRAKWLRRSVRQPAEAGLADGESGQVTDVAEVRPKFGLRS
jgi:hypothetical protein